MSVTEIWYWSYYKNFH